MAPTLRIVTLNFWGDRAPLERRIALAVRQLEALAPDVVALQEVAPLEGGTTADRLAAPLGMECCTAAASPDGALGSGLDLAILARHPIAERRVETLPEARPDETRVLLSARVEVGARSIWCHTAHLHWRLDDGAARERQVVALDDAARARGPDTPQILCGDLNAPPDSDEIRYLRGLTSLGGRRTFYQDAFGIARPGEPGYTWSMENPHQTAGRSVPFDRRIDFIFVTPAHKDGRGRVRDARVVLTERDDAGICASDHYGVAADVQIAPSGAS